MKKGKTSRLNILPDARCVYGTVDAKELKSLYLVIQCWIEPSDFFCNWDRIIGNLERSIRHTVIDSLDFIFFKRYNIVDLDIRSSGIKEGKRSFLNLEITLFTTENNTNFKSRILKDKLKILITDIYINDLKNSKYFTIHKTKNKVKVS